MHLLHIENPKHLANRIFPWHLPNSSGDASFMRRGHESRPNNADNTETTSLQGPEVTCEGMSLAFLIRGPPEEQAPLVFALHAFVQWTLDRDTRAASRCCAHCAVLGLRSSLPLPFLRASQQFYMAHGCKCLEQVAAMLPFVRRVRDKLRIRLNVIT